MKLFLALLTSTLLFAQGPGRPIPDLTPEQAAALSQMNMELSAPQGELAAARQSMVDLTYSESPGADAIKAKAKTVEDAEFALATARAQAFAKLQASPAKLTPNQIAALILRSNVLPPSRNYDGTIPGITAAQIAVLTKLSTDLLPLTRSLTTARVALTASSLASPAGQAEIRLKAQAVAAAELRLAEARTTAFAKIQASSEKLPPSEVKAFADLGGSFAGFRFTQPAPLNFPDHDGYVSLFDGVSLKGWDGNPKFWRAEAGAIIGESTAQNPSGNSYIVYRGVTAKDFTLKFEMKVEGSGGSGFQYRSKTGLPWLSNIPDNVTANVGPVNLNWMMTGPQADFWPSSRDYSGQFYSENTPMRILAWRGQVVEGSGLSRKQLMGNIGDREALGKLVKMNDWNEYTVIARGGTLIQILNGQLMAVMVDDDADSSNNQPGLFGIEIEAITKVSVRNIWLKKIN
jgi:hypothetical protein